MNTANMTLIKASNSAAVLLKEVGFTTGKSLVLPSTLILQALNTTYNNLQNTIHLQKSDPTHQPTIMLSPYLWMFAGAYLTTPPTFLKCRIPPTLITSSTAAVSKRLQ